MTPSEIETMARRKYNAVGDTFWSQEELFDLMYQGAMELALDAEIIEATDSTTLSVIGQQEYDFPSLAINIKRVTYNGNKLQVINFREDDAMTLSNSTTTATGTPQFYAIWDRQIYLRPVPAVAGDTIKIFSVDAPSAITVSTTLSIPAIFHPSLADFMLREMCAKDENINLAEYYSVQWSKAVERAKKWKRKHKRSDSFGMVLDEESVAETYFGAT